MSSTVPQLMIVAGEASGDQYGAHVVRALRRRLPDVQCFGIGGDTMAAEGVELLYHIEQTAIMGFVEVARNAVFLRRMFRDCRRQLHERRPDAVLLIDYPGFNLRLARHIKKAGIQLLYYISPQVWAWGKGRAAKMRGLVDHLAVVFPFEEEIFRNAGVPVSFVGHPLLEILGHGDRNDFLAKHGLAHDLPILGLFPGSRKQEVDRLLPSMLEAAVQVRAETPCSIAIGAAQLSDAIYQRHLHGRTDIHLLRNATHALMQHSYAAVVASGTATVETAFYETPMVVVYRTSFLNYQIGKRLIHIDNIGMANILAGKRIVPELLQQDVNARYIADYLLPWFADEQRHAEVSTQLARVRERMGSKGASDRVAALLQDMMSGR
jgi:lipid-A-disaccharide synthase